MGNVGSPVVTHICFGASGVKPGIYKPASFPQPGWPSNGRPESFLFLPKLGSSQPFTAAKGSSRIGVLFSLVWLVIDGTGLD